MPRSSHRQVERLLREAVYRRLLDPAGLRRAVEAHPRRRGRRVVREVAGWIDDQPATESPLEARLVRRLARLPLPPWSTQVAVVGASGRRYRADVALPSVRLIVEGDGRDGHATPEGFERDRRRDADLAAAGWQTIRVTGAQLRRSARDVDGWILAAVRARSPT
ncbi:endonuclease domain-containing protein [Patulibacter defluvii]|uniref:endonuclease domain-containing protein n=1 Tax=Patulibacter defluvii TaxID=3095358 RepID=UPI002A74A3BA|nr:DUF559 domain-containing protein [Patulibacter sp. DM4]